MRELSKVEMEQISGGCLTDIVTGVNTGIPFDFRYPKYII